MPSMNGDSPIKKNIIMFKLNPLLYCLLVVFASATFTFNEELPTEKELPELIKLDPLSGEWVDLSKFVKGASNCFVIQGDEMLIGKEDGLYKSKLNASKMEFIRESSMTKPVFDIIHTQAGNTYIHGLEEGLHYKPLNTPLWIQAYDVIEKSKIFTVWENKDGRVLAGGPRGIFLSENGGLTWKKVYTEGHIRGFESKGNDFFAATSHGILHSQDKGKTWSASNPKNLNINKIVANEINAAAIILAESAFSGDSIMIDATIGPKNIQRNFLYLLNPKAASWDNVSDHLPSYVNINDVLVSGKSIICSLDSGIFKSDDLGKSWKLLRKGDGKTVYRLSQHKSTIYAMKSFNGC